MYFQFQENTENAYGSLEIFQAVENWYWQACFPGCLPDSDPIGPFSSFQEAYADSQSEI